MVRVCLYANKTGAQVVSGLMRHVICVSRVDLCVWSGFGPAAEADE